MVRSTSLLAISGPLSLVLLAACRASPAPDSGTALETFADGEADSGAAGLPAGDPVPTATDADGDGSIAGVDCDDSDPTAFPGATEGDDLVDNDCDGWVDEDFVGEGDVIVTEIHRQPRIGAFAVVNDGQWIEIHNTSDRTVDLSNWVFARGASAPYNEVTIEASRAPVLLPGAYATLCALNDYEGSAGVAYPLSCDYVWRDETQPTSYVSTYADNTLILRRDTDRVAFFVEGSRTTGREIDAVRWYYDATNGFWPRDASFSMSLDPAYLNGTQNDEVAAWCSTTESASGIPVRSASWSWYDVPGTVVDEFGTPGAANYDCPVDPDLDGDGYTGTDDCDDADPNINPGAAETCDGVDNDCDGSVDEDASDGNVYYGDGDGDGYGDPADTTLACTAPTGYTDNADDCDDTDAAVSPDGVESDDLADDDCDGWVDEDFVSAGDLVITEVNRQARIGGASITSDGTWVEVYNASSRTVDLSNWVLSRGHSAPYNQVAIDPAEAPLLAPGAYAVFCDTALYEGGTGVPYPLACDYVWSDLAEASSYVGEYKDNTFLLRRDADTFALYVAGTRTTGTLVDSVRWSYDATNGYWPRDARFSMSLDPAYFDATLNDVRDVWCSTASSASGTASNDTSWQWYDVSGTTNDEHGSPGAANYNCPNDPDLDGDGYTGADDCDDTDAAINPGATETCNGIDDDCSGVADDNAADGTVWYGDGDGDGYGDAGNSTVSCAAPSGYTTDATDCDDGDVGTNPGAAEVCNDGIDNDCDPDPTVCEWSGSQQVKTEFDFRAYGTGANYAVGHAVANNGDFDGDGFDDVIVGQAYHDVGAVSDAGRTLLWYGPVDTSDGLGTADLGIEGDATVAGDQFGWKARFAGDVDGDGLDDLLSSSWRAGSADEGAAYLFLGGTSPTSVASAHASFAPSEADAYAGQAIDGADIDGDGRADVLVSAYGRSSSAGAVGIWDALAIGGGAESLDSDATLLIESPTADAYFGYAAAFVPDLDGDGLADLVVGAPAAGTTTTPGTAYVWYGPGTLAGTLSTADADATLTGASNGDDYGLTVAGLGDTDGDGYNEFAVTADKDDAAATDAGAVYIYGTAPSGSVAASAATSTILGVAAEDYFGRTVAGVGDTNGDGLADVFVGATGYVESGLVLAGAVHLWYGPLPTGTSSASTYDFRMTGANTADAVGYAVGGGGDVNGDGYADFMASAPSWDGFGFLNAGGSWLYYGRGE